MQQHYSHDDSYEREPLESSHAQYDTPPRRPVAQNPAYDYSQPASQPASPYHDDAPVRLHQADSSSSSSSRSPGHHNHPHPYAPDEAAPASPGMQDNAEPPPPPRHGDYSYYNRGGPSRGADDAAYAPRPGPSSVTPGADNFSASASGGMSGIAYNVADRNARESGLDAMRATSQIPPPPSRAQYPNAARPPYLPHGNGGYLNDPNNPRGGNLADRDSHSSLNPFGTTVGTPSGTHSPARSMRSFAPSDSYADDPYQAYSTVPRNGGSQLGVVDPDDIEDDGDDGLHYPRRNQRNSMLSASNSDRGAKQAIGAAAAVGGAAAAGGAMGGLLGRHGHDGSGDHVYDAGASREKSSAWLSKKKGGSKKWKWIVIIAIFLIIAGAIVGGVVGALVAGNKNGGKDSGGGGGGGGSASDDTNKNGDLNINSPEIKALLNNPNLHKVFPGMDYTPFNTQYPSCIQNPPSQNNVTRDVAVLSQLTNKIRLYGTDCNQTQMLLHAIDQLQMKDSIKVWLGVWQDNNETTNARQLQQMWTILDDYGDAPFEGIIVANEVLFRQDMTITRLGTILDGVRTNLTAKKLNLPVATSDLGDDWTSTLAADSDYVMANIHPFFAGVSADQAAAWTYNFWKEKDGPLWKSDKQKNMNRFMSDWVCQALANGTNYFWFEAFDEPWKVQFNTPGKEWEDKWGLMDINRKLKAGVKIPDCGGKTVS
ncbi:putative glucan endo-1,3-beta-glucosidase btgC [Tolypocladium ophioglossoides CBS 100239]|uniref:glucan endo-1,3-beta-D-glucosidase n=1 Tax=Tolypocladium ophioglossoides (strain CBS 100239) TaxID=1163406 RepID=A0A0L0NCN2_TOLOC|nr:putative glucan endo-1,3-beta-glucosidase btgC [Tolypocladium ophioglossoides CBS 100239]